MFCSISGTVPEEPVVDKNSGHLFEKRLITKYIEDGERKNPVTGHPLALDDLIDVVHTPAVKPRAAPATSIPGLLSLFHNEWDATMLEMHNVRKDLGNVRQELAHALYQHDASVRVVARLQRELAERDSLLAKFENAEVAPAANGRQAASDGPASKKAKQGIPADVVAAIDSSGTKISKGRKTRQISPTLAGVPEVASLELEATYPLHKTTQGGILALDFEEGKEGLIFTAGADHTGQVYDRAAGRILSTLKGHSKKLTDVKYCGKHGVAITTSADKTAIIHKPDAEGLYTPVAVLKDHSSEVVAAAIQVTGDYLVTASQDKSWAFYDIPTATCLQQFADASMAQGYSTAKYHPDGILLGTGTSDSQVRIWEMRTQKQVAKLSHSSGPITALSFSENGYYLASSAGDGVRLWDLRKLAAVREISAPSAPSFVTFDHSGLYLAIGREDVEIRATKQDYNVVKTFSDMSKKGAYCGKWGTDAKSFFVGAADHNLRHYSIAADAGAVPMTE